MTFNFRLPYFSFESSGLLVLFGISLYVSILLGYFMNFENVYTYCPDISLKTQLSDFPNKFWVSLLGVLIWPIGAVTGWMW